MKRVLVVTGGHPFDPDSFFAMFDAAPDLSLNHVAQPEARTWLHPDRAGDYDVAVLYDMPGIEFTRSDPPVVFTEPPDDHVAGFEALLDAGKGMVFLHHAIAGWPRWDTYAEIVGGRFHYQPAVLRGVDWPDSGYRHDVHQTIDVVDTGHPICAGLPSSFEVVDEAYLCPIFDDDVVPLLRSDHRFEADGFFSADLAIRGRRDSNEGWGHPAGSDLVGWVKHHGRSPIAYLQFGDGPTAHEDPNVRRLLSNAIAWAASSEAREWAGARSTSRSSE
jgi:type 1 glutamine amidotransferase